jgi:hypothetical protein
VITGGQVRSPGDASGGCVRLAVLAPNSTAHSDTSLVANSACHYKIRAINDHYPLAWTPEACAWTLPLP